MQVIDHTPYLSEKGELSLLDRLKGTLQFGFSWYPQLEAQRVVITRLGKQLGRRYVLLRNATLPRSEISVPLILVGPPGVYMLYATHQRGMYRAKGDTWGTLEGDQFRPAAINLLTRTARLARAVHVYLKRQGWEALETVEPVLIGADPGLHVDSVRPTVRVVLSDAIERFAASLAQARVVLSPESADDIVERLQAARPPHQAAGSSAEPASPDPFLPAPVDIEPGPPAEWNPADYEFTFDETVETETEATVELPTAAPARPARKPAPQAARRRGMSAKHWLLLGALGLVQACVLLAFAYLVLSDIFLP
jgi:hypothetical protein